MTTTVDLDSTLVISNTANTTRELKMTGHVGFASLPDQIVTKCVEKSFHFNILCIGETGLGKSTLMNSLFNTTFESAPSCHNLSKNDVKSDIYTLQENNVKLKLQIVNTIGYGDQINKEESLQAIVDFIDSKFEEYLQEELKIIRLMSCYHDKRIHVCLYFICPTGHGLKSLDLSCMKKIHQKVNIVPIIAKADTMSRSELIKFKKQIMSELEKSGINIYKFPIDDDNIAEINSEMNEHVPFAVVASTDFVYVGDKKVRSRQYPWGSVQIENERHCDFVKLREMLIRTNMDDLREMTHNKHYELYRIERLKEMGFDTADQPIMTYQEVLKSKFENCQLKFIERENKVREKVFERVEAADAEHQKIEQELIEKFNKMKDQYLEEKKKFEYDRKKLDDEIIEYHRLKDEISSASPRRLSKGKKKKNNSLVESLH